MIKNMMFAVATLLVLGGAPGAYAQTEAPMKNPGSERMATCPAFGTPSIRVVQHKGKLYQNHHKTAFEIARQKSTVYNGKMPLRQGNIGRARMKVDTDIKLITYPSMGCIVIESLAAKVTVDHEVEFAAEHEPGTCMYGEFYNLEMELMQQDEVVINTELQKMRNELKEDLGKNNVYGPISGMDLDLAEKQKKQELQHLVQHKIDKIAEKIFELRQQSDLPEFYEEIKADCSGG